MNWQPIARIGLTVALSALAGGVATHQTLSTPTAKPAAPIEYKSVSSNNEQRQAPVVNVTVLPVDFSKLKMPPCPSLSIDGVKR